MKLGDLYQFVSQCVEQDKMDLDTPVIAVGEYNYGQDLGKARKAIMSNIDESNIVCENKEVITLSIDSYLHESEDMGYCDMWIDKDDLDSFKEELVEEE